MIDTTTKYLGLELPSPVIATASPVTSRIEGLQALAEAGAGAAVLPSLFEEQIEHDTMAVHYGLELGSGIFAEAAEGYFPEMDDYNTGPDDYVRSVTEAKRSTNMAIIPSINGYSRGGWVRYAHQLEDAGADAIELNIYFVAADPTTTARELEDRYVRLVEEVRMEITVPLAVKIGPAFSSVPEMARRLFSAGANGLVLFNRFYQPDIDLDSMRVEPNLILSDSAEMRQVLRWTAILHGRVEGSLCATTGVHSADDAVKLLLAGADVIGMASALLKHGPGHVRTVLDGMNAWLEEREYVSVDQARGSLSQQNSPEPAAYERANYIKTLASWS
jgi:dihydroorotate dehydrogenase (fumarate)